MTHCTVASKSVRSVTFACKILSNLLHTITNHTNLNPNDFNRDCIWIIRRIVNRRLADCVLVRNARNVSGVWQGSMQKGIRLGGWNTEKL